MPRARSEPYPGKVHRPGLRAPARGVDESLTGARSGTPRPRDLKLGPVIEPLGPSRTPPPPSRYPAWGPGTAPPNVRKFDRPYLAQAEPQELQTPALHRPRGPLSDAAYPEPVEPWGPEIERTKVRTLTCRISPRPSPRNFKLGAEVDPEASYQTPPTPSRWSPGSRRYPHRYRSFDRPYPTQAEASLSSGDPPAPP